MYRSRFKEWGVGKNWTSDEKDKLLAYFELLSRQQHLYCLGLSDSSPSITRWFSEIGLRKLRRHAYARKNKQPSESPTSSESFLETPDSSEGILETTLSVGPSFEDATT